MERITITRRLNSIKQEFFKALLSRKDFKTKLELLKQANPSEFHTVCASLCDMLDVVEIEYDKDKVAYLCELILDGKLSEYEETKNQCITYFESIILNAKLPEFIALEKEMLNILFEKFSDYPDPSEYMKRIVDRCANSANKWKKDSLRLRILKQFIKYGNCLVYQTECDGKSKKVSVYGWEKRILTYANAKKQDQEEKQGRKKITEPCNAVAFVDEGIFAEYDSVIQELQEQLHRIQQSEILNACRQKVAELKKQEKQLEKAKNKTTETDELLNVVKAQLKEAEAQLKEEEKSLNRAKQKLKDEKKKYGLVRLADDLASGKFTAAGVTKRDLYLFAVVFDMTYYCPNETGNSETLERYDTDIEKNLFTDYYTNNLMRFLTKAYQGRLSGVEVDPSGQGINYKNFAEMVFIYYIAKDSAPIDKITGIYEMLARLENSSQNHMKAKSFGTAFYRSIFTEDILKLSETDFEDFIKSNYDCTFTDENGKKLNKSEFQLQTNQNTAFEVYCELIDAMTNLKEPVSRKNSNYGLWITEASTLNESQNSSLANVITGDSEKIKSFITLLKRINSFMEFESFVKEDSDSITRTAIVVAYYYYYNTRNSYIGVKKNLQEVYNDYTNEITGLNAILLEAYMQPISDKNIFDLFVIFSSYAHLMN